MSRHLAVRLYDEPVGELRELPTGRIEFRFLAAYRERSERATLGQKFIDDLGRSYRGKHAGQLPPFFANLVPEGRLREVIGRQAKLGEGDDLGLLEFVGTDLPGAVTVHALPDGLNEEEDTTSDFSAPAEADSLPEALGLRFSLAGVQLKFSMLRDGEKLTLPAHDQRGDWIVKLSSPHFAGLPENEFVMLEWARAAGFDVPETRLEPASHLAGLPREFAPPGSRFLAVRRYDRSPGGVLIHQEDFAQVTGLPPSLKYEQVTYGRLARFAERLMGTKGLDEYVRRMTLVIATGNNDAHLKNWSLIYPDRVKPQWSPLYDQVFTLAWPDQSATLALDFAGFRYFTEIAHSSFELLARRQPELPVDRVLEVVNATLSALRAAWRTHSSTLPLPASHRAALLDHWQRVPLLREAGPLE